MRRFAILRAFGNPGIRHRLSFPTAPTSRGDAAPVQGGGDLPERLCTSGLSVTNGGRDSSSERVSPGLVVGDRAGVR